MRGLPIVLFALALLLTLTRPLGGGLAQGSGGKVLRVQQGDYPDVIDPQKSSYTAELVVIGMAYEGLTRLDEHMNTVPAAAQSWEFSADGTTLTFHLRPGLTYSDGSPLTAERFRYAVERTCDPHTAGQYQSILFDVVGCQQFASSLTATPAAGDQTAVYNQAKAALGVSASDGADPAGESLIQDGYPLGRGTAPRLRNAGGTRLDLVIVTVDPLPPTDAASTASPVASAGAWLSNWTASRVSTATAAGQVCLASACH